MVPSQLTSRRSCSLPLLLLTAMLCLMPRTAAATTYTWTGNLSSDWFTSGNWNDGSLAGTPGPGDTAIVNFGTTTIGNTSVSIASLQLGGGNVIGGTGTLTLTGSSTFTSGGLGGNINNTGTVSWPSGAGNINALPGGIFYNTGTFNAAANSTWAAFSGGTGQQFNNIGTLNASGTLSQYSQFGGGANFKNNGTVNLTAGVLGIGDGTSTGTFNSSAGAFLRFNINTHTLTGSARFIGAGRGQIVAGGTVSLNGSMIGGQAGGTFELIGGNLSTVPTGGTVTGALTLSGGNLSGTINANGTTSWPLGAGNINVLPNCIFNNNGTFSAQANATWAAFSGGTGQQFNNKATLNASGTASQYSQFGGGANFRNTGTVNVTAGVLGIADGTSSGTFNCSVDSFARFNANTHTLTGGAKFTGAGRSQIVGGGTVSIDGSIVGGLSGGALDLNGGLLTTVAGGGTVTGGLMLSNGALSGTIHANGATVWPANGGNITVLAGCIFNNKGTFAAQANAVWAAFTGGSGQQFNNIGTLNATGTLSAFSQFGSGSNFRNIGIVNVTAGVLGISEGTSSGTFNCSAGAFARFNNTTHTLTGGAKFLGAGRSQITGGGAVSIQGSIIGSLSGGTLELTGGALTTVAGGGIVTGGMMLSSGSISGTINNTGTVVWPASGGGNITVLTNSIFNNYGTFIAQANATWAAFNGGTGQQFNNLGTLNATGTLSAFSQFGSGSNFKNTGTVNITAGILGVSEGTSSGTFNTSGGSFLRFNNTTHTLTGGAKFTGAGRGQVTSGGAVTINGSIVGGVAGGTFELAGGTLGTVVAGGTITGGLMLSSGNISGTINANGTTVWPAGSGNINALPNSIFNNNGTFNALANATWAAFSGGSGQQFNNKGVLNLPAPGSPAITVPFTQNAAGSLNIALGGVSAGTNYDRLQLGTPVTLGGTLNVALINGFQPVNGTLFTIATFPTGARGSSTFGSVNAPGFTVAYTATGVDLTANGTAYPKITSFTPLSGAVGTSVVITGTNFTGATAVKFNTTTATFTVNSATQITATVPAGATTGKISVKAPGGTAISTATFTVPLLVPTITSFTPISGPVGSSVVVTGTNFTGAQEVRINGTNAAFVVNSATQITLTVPVGATTGKIGVVTPGGAVLSASVYTVVPAPLIYGFTPTTGGGGASVVITGLNFTGATSVKFNGVSATYTVNSTTQITATAPANATTGKISVTTLGGTANRDANFTFAINPVISSFSPASGPVGTVVTILGTTFNGVTAVTFNGVSAGAAGSGYVVNSPTQITAKVPVGATTGKIGVTIATGSGLSSANFTVTAASAPVVTGFTPSGGASGAVTLSGAGLTGATAVSFNGAAATFTVNSATQITAQIPAAAVSGPITVTTPNGSFTTASSFVAAPRITVFSPGSGTVGTFITISGVNLNGATLVTFNGVPASFSVVSPGQILASVPAGATTGPIAVTSVAGTGTRAGFVVSP